jgi:ABC-type glycerol-3-phosphate transport system permease component
MSRAATNSRFAFGRQLIFVVLFGYAVWVIYPLLWVAYSSLKADEAIFLDAFQLPDFADLRFGNYARAWEGAHFGEYFLNSVIVTGTSVLAIVLLGAMAGYALSRFYHPAGRAVFWLFLAGLMIPIQLGMVPLFFELRQLGLLNSRLGLVLV